MRFSDLESPRVAILGAGREGRAVWRQLRTRFPRKRLAIFAESPMDADFLEGLDAALDTCHVGPFDVDRLRDFDVLVRSAGISPYREELKTLEARGARFTTATNLWFAEHPDARTICITGTKGKSTTAALTAHLMNGAGVRTRLAGNIGRPMLDEDGDHPEWWVIELSSYQVADLEAKPSVAALLNLSAEHIDWHGGFERYRDDKLRLVDRVTDGVVVANAGDRGIRDALAGRDRVAWFNRAGGWVADQASVKGPGGRVVAAPEGLPGRHNMHNLAAALTILDTIGLEVNGLDTVLASFRGLPHRLQLLGERDGVRYVNDSISTTPVSVTAALQTLGGEGVVLLLGGMDRGLDWTGFARALPAFMPHAIVTMPDNGPRISACLVGEGVEPAGGLHAAGDLAEAVGLAQSLVPAGGCVLLSPGAPSFPHFRDYEERGSLFQCYAGIEKGA